MPLIPRLALIIAAGLCGQPNLHSETAAADARQGEGRSSSATSSKSASPKFTPPKSGALKSGAPEPGAASHPKDAIREAAAAGPSTETPAVVSGSWRRVRNPNAADDPTAFLRTADLDRSDPRLAGLMLRCGENGIEIVIVVVGPFPPRAQPKITLRVAEQHSYFVGSIIPTGTGIRLPLDATKLADGSWLGSRELEIKIADGDAEIEGLVPLSGLAAAMGALRSACVLK